MNNSKNLMYSFLLCVTFVDFNDCITVSNDQISIKSDHIKNHVTQKSGDNSHSSITKQNIASEVLDTIEKTSLKKGHVLFFHQLGTKSHIFLQKTLVEGLLKQGHQVTTVFYVKTSINHENYTEVLINDRYDRNHISSGRMLRF